jgi:Flp pilus assembly secretin CpaC
MTAKPTITLPQPAPPAPRPSLGIVARIMLTLGALGGLVTVLGVAAVAVLLLNNVQLEFIAPGAAPAAPAEISDQPAPDAADFRTVEPIVVTPSSDRKAQPPEELEVKPAPRAPAAPAIARDRTKLTLQVRFVDFDHVAAQRLGSDQTLKSGLSDGGSLLESLRVSTPGEGTTGPRSFTTADLPAALGELERHGVVRVVATPKVTTFHRRPARFVERGELAAADAGKAGGETAKGRPYTATLDCLPEVVDCEKKIANLEVFAEISVPTGVRDAAGVPIHSKQALMTSIKIADGQTLALGGLSEKRGPDGKVADHLVLLTTNFQPPDAVDSIVPLSEAELRDRRQEQARFLQDQLARQFPESKVTLIPAAGRLFVKGTAKDPEELGKIMALVRQRAVDEWAMVEGKVAPDSPWQKGGDRSQSDGPLVNMLLVPQVVIRLRLLELDAKAAAAALDAAGPDRDAATGSPRLLRALLSLSQPGSSTSLDGLDAAKLDAEITKFGKQALVRAISEPTVITVSGHLATLASGDAVELPTTVEGGGKLSGKSHRYPVGSIFHALPVILDDEHVRLEVTRDFRQVLGDGRQENPPRLLFSSQTITAVAVMHKGQTLAFAGPPAEPAESAKNVRQFVLVTAEVVRPGETPDLPAVAQTPPSPAAPPAVAAVTAPKAEPPHPVDNPALARTLPKAQPADYQESVDAASVQPPAPEKAERLPPTQAEPVSLEKIAQEGALIIEVGQQRRLLAPEDVLRATAVDPTICDVARSAAREVTIRGKAPGDTDVTLWFQDQRRRPASFGLRVVKDLKADELGRRKHRVLEDVLAELFPMSKVELRLADGRLDVEGEAVDAAEANQIMAVVREEMAVAGAATSVRVFDRLRVTGPRRVDLRLMFLALDPAEVRKSADDLKHRLPKAWPLAASLLELAEKGGHAVLDPAEHGDLNPTLHDLERSGTLRVLGQPTLTTPNGQVATYVLPDTWDLLAPSQAADAPGGTRPLYATFRFRPAIVDRDQVRLEVTPEVRPAGERNGTGPDVRPATVTGQLRLGRTLAIGGLFDGQERGRKLLVLVRPERGRAEAPVVTASRPESGRTESPPLEPLPPKLPRPEPPRPADAASPTRPSGLINPISPPRPTTNIRKPSSAGYDVAESDESSAESPGQAPNSEPTRAAAPPPRKDEGLLPRLLRPFQGAQPKSSDPLPADEQR